MAGYVKFEDLCLAINPSSGVICARKSGHDGWHAATADTDGGAVGDLWVADPTVDVHADGTVFAIAEAEAIMNGIAP